MGKPVRTPQRHNNSTPAPPARRSRAAVQRSSSFKKKAPPLAHKPRASSPPDRRQPRLAPAPPPARPRKCRAASPSPRRPDASAPHASKPRGTRPPRDDKNAHPPAPRKSRSKGTPPPDRGSASPAPSPTRAPAAKARDKQRRMSSAADAPAGAMRAASPAEDPQSSASLVTPAAAAAAAARAPPRRSHSTHQPRERASRPEAEGAGRRQPRMYKDPTLRARVPRHVLEGGTAPPFRRRLLSRVFRSMRPNQAVKVEPLESGLATSVLYAPELARDGATSSAPFVPTMLVSDRARASDPNVVYQDSPFEIRVSGMLARNFDRWAPSNDNELLMYSIQTDPATTGDTNSSLPFIHYDFQRDGSRSTEQPNIYIPIPASKSYVMSSAGKPRNGSADAKMKKMLSQSNSKNTLQKSVNVQFKILEIDNPSETVKQAVSGIDELGGFVSSFSAAAPYLGVLSPALGLASAVSKRALDSYAQPDKVISIDMDFLLADRKRVRLGTASPGEYLRYGYYFFLSEPIEGKLYASVRTPKNVQLMFKRCDVDKNMPAKFRGDPVISRRYFPLTEISYLVVRVVEPTGMGRMSRRPIQMSHSHQLENIFNRAKMNDDPQAIKTALQDLGRELGVIDSDSEDEARPASAAKRAARAVPRT